MTIYASEFDLATVSKFYEKYSSAGAVKPQQTINYEEIRKYSEAANLGLTSPLQLNAMLEDVLRQPIMSDFYAANQIKPEEVNDYIENVKQQTSSMKKNILTSLMTSYGQAAISYQQEHEPLVNGQNEWISLGGYFSPVSAVAQSMKDFKEKKMQKANKKLSFTQKVMRYVKDKGIKAVKTLATGSCDNIKMAMPNEPVRAEQKQMNIDKNPKTY